MIRIPKIIKINLFIDTNVTDIRDGTTEVSVEDLNKYFTTLFNDALAKSAQNTREIYGHSATPTVQQLNIEIVEFIFF